MAAEIGKNMENRFKVLFVIDSLGTGGAERNLAEKLPHLRNLGVRIVVVSLRHREEGIQEQIQKLGFDVRILCTSGLIGRIAALRTIISTECPDVIQTVLFHSDIAGRLSAIGTSIKVISRLANTDYDPIRLNDPHINGMKFRMARIIDGWTARHLTHYVYANSNAVKHAAMRDLGISERKITVIPEGRDSIRLGKPSPSRRMISRIRLGLDEDQEVLINIGRQDFQKGQRYLLEAVAKLASSHPRLLLLVAGRNGDDSGALESLRDRLDLKNQVLFLNHRGDVPDLLAAADIFVFPSFYEGLPGAVIEAMALGLPILASNIAPVREIVEEGRNAILVRPGSPAELSSAIEQILGDRQMAQSFGIRSRQIFEERFTLEQNMGQLMEFYRHVLSPI